MKSPVCLMFRRPLPDTLVPQAFLCDMEQLTGAWRTAPGVFPESPGPLTPTPRFVPEWLLLPGIWCFQLNSTLKTVIIWGDR